MNLHIVPDNTFSNKFYDNLLELNLSGNNKIVVRTNEEKLKNIKHALPFAPLYSKRFASLVGDTAHYKKVFIHYFTPLLYRWVATHTFQELNWMIWGGDLYNLSSLDELCYEPLTLNNYVRQDWSAQTKLYNLKVLLTQRPFQKKAYSKVKNILTWMTEEYKFALDHLPINADHKFFFYENQLPYGRLDGVIRSSGSSDKLSLIIGNSGSPTNNHLDAVKFLEDSKISADLYFPVSYGDARYISFLKKNIKFSFGRVEFIERFMPFDEYLNFIVSADGLVMNSTRPQGYGNILMMMYIGKPVFFNSKNISLPDLNAAGLKWFSLESLKSLETLKNDAGNKVAVMNLLSHERLLKEYQILFS
ncbi:TDP-N-acetylfucosamine:lipid II N-acetylfucosaminyltransferase [Chryseolinea sp. H1M3-3]|uniref:TDP-N-acetylfucosamine:lipid II N-acetylfucosaminyltransferase n=1 Tax=Chryseolinea sp. H1M3-3 TaxID=3034144 RepID=UPI0023EC3282|nr:TDP-N-acetylfucosamine:lipid II N-acetylfucosaminyltransferase [Chryseolinea sp. H1M3-3]